MPVIRWEDPPQSRNRHWIATLADLQKRPGEWACVEEGATEDYARCVAWKSLSPRGAEVAIRKRDDGYSVYARWPENADLRKAAR